MTVMRHCEVCEQPIPDGQEVVHPEEGDSYCARCVVDLIGGERDALTRQLAGAVAERDRLRAQLKRVNDLLGAVMGAGTVVVPDGRGRALQRLRELADTPDGAHRREATEILLNLIGDPEVSVAFEALEQQPAPTADPATSPFRVPSGQPTE